MLDPFGLLAMNAPADEYDNASLQISRRISVSDYDSQPKGMNTHDADTA